MPLEPPVTTTTRPSKLRAFGLMNAPSRNRPATTKAMMPTTSRLVSRAFIPARLGEQQRPRSGARTGRRVPSCNCRLCRLAKFKPGATPSGPWTATIRMPIAMPKKRRCLLKRYPRQKRRRRPSAGVSAQTVVWPHGARKPRRTACRQPRECGVLFVCPSCVRRAAQPQAASSRGAGLVAASCSVAELPVANQLERVRSAFARADKQARSACR